MLRFRATAIDFEKFQKRIENYKQNNRMIEEYDLDIAVLRTDRNDLVPHYQVIVRF